MRTLNRNPACVRARARVMNGTSVENTSVETDTHTYGTMAHFNDLASVVAPLCVPRALSTTISDAQLFRESAHLHNAIYVRRTMWCGAPEYNGNACMHTLQMAARNWIEAANTIEICLTENNGANDKCPGCRRRFERDAKESIINENLRSDH